MCIMRSCIWGGVYLCIYIHVYIFIYIHIITYIYIYTQTHTSIRNLSIIELGREEEDEEVNFTKASSRSSIESSDPSSAFEQEGVCELISEILRNTFYNLISEVLADDFCLTGEPLAFLQKIE
jgi:hypothetical protein